MNAGTYYVYVYRRAWGDNTNYTLTLRVGAAIQLNLDVPFKAQVPPGEWGKTQNCGQASSLMVFCYYLGTVPDADGIKDIDDWLNEKYGDPTNNYNGSPTTTAQLSALGSGYAGLSQTYAASDWGLDRLKEEIEAGHPVIVALVAGHLSNRGYAWAGGHFVVAKGCTATEIICNDPGTSQGHNKKYKNEEFEAAMEAQGGSVVVPMPSAPLTILEEDFDGFSNLYVPDDLLNAGWTVVNGGGEPVGAWRLWNTAGNMLGNEDPDIESMTDNYMITNSDLAGTVDLDQELITPEIDCTNHTKVRLNFNKNYRVYADDTADDQVAEVDVREVGGDWVNLLHYDRTTVGVYDTAAEVVDLSAYDGKVIQIRFHFYEANFAYWFAVDKIRVCGEPSSLP